MTGEWSNHSLLLCHSRLLFILDDHLQQEEREGVKRDRWNDRMTMFSLSLYIPFSEFFTFLCTLVIQTRILQLREKRIIVNIMSALVTFNWDCFFLNCEGQRTICYWLKVERNTFDPGERWRFFCRSFCRSMMFYVGEKMRWGTTILIGALQMRKASFLLEKRRRTKEGRKECLCKRWGMKEYLWERLKDSRSLKTIECIESSDDGDREISFQKVLGESGAVKTTILTWGLPPCIHIFWGQWQQCSLTKDFTYYSNPFLSVSHLFTPFNPLRELLLKGLQSPFSHLPARCSWMVLHLGIFFEVFQNLSSSLLNLLSTDGCFGSSQCMPVTLSIHLLLQSFHS